MIVAYVNRPFRPHARTRRRAARLRRAVPLVRERRPQRHARCAGSCVTSTATAAARARSRCGTRRSGRPTGGRRRRPVARCAPTKVRMFSTVSFAERRWPVTTMAWRTSAPARLSSSSDAARLIVRLAWSSRGHHHHRESSHLPCGPRETCPRIRFSSALRTCEFLRRGADSVAPPCHHHRRPFRARRLSSRRRRPRGRLRRGRRISAIRRGIRPASVCCHPRCCSSGSLLFFRWRSRSLY